MGEEDNRKLNVETGSVFCLTVSHKNTKIDSASVHTVDTQSKGCT